MKHRKIFMAIGLIFIMFFTARAYFIYQDLKIEREIRQSVKNDKAEIAVSYTHLTLPTKA